MISPVRFKKNFQQMQYEGKCSKQDTDLQYTEAVLIRALILVLVLV